jgi:hypothetical protein
MVFLALICKKKKKMLAPKKIGLAPELLLVFSTPVHKTTVLDIPAVKLKFHSS